MFQRTLFIVGSLFCGFCVCFAVCVCFAGGQAAPPAAATPVAVKPKLLVPAYFYPDGRGLKHWDHLIAAASKASIVAIANPASGPGNKVDANYTAVIKKAQEAKVKVIGYVSTSYAKRPVADVKADVDQWLKHYPTIEGIFFDEQVSAAEKVNYYVDLKTHVRAKIPKSLVVANPGVECAEEYFAKESADVFCVIESGKGLDKYVPPNWAAKYPADRFYGLAYGIDKSAGMTASVQAAKDKRLGYLFVTNDVLDNPWDTLPPYWEAEVNAVK